MTDQDDNTGADAPPAAKTPADTGRPSASGRAFRLLVAALRRDIVRFSRRAFSLAASVTRAASAKVKRSSLRVSQVVRSEPAAGPGEESRLSRFMRHAAGFFPVRKIRLKGGTALIAGAVAAIVLLVGLVAVWALHDVPLAKIAEETADPIVVLKAADGNILVQQGPYRGANATIADFPDHLVKAVLSIEDRRFFRHWGLDFRGMARALVRNVTAGEVVEGGSTITQQMLKILYLERDRTIRRKIQEAFLALWIESRTTKEEILERYLNSIYLGAGASGIPAAARIYFNKTVDELTLPESAMLAGLIKAPSQLNPLENPEGAARRASVVIGAMRDAGHLADDAERDRYARAVSEIALNPGREEAGGGSWFTDWIRPDAREIAGSFRGNIEVTTTLIPELQKLAEEAITAGLSESGEQAGATQAALIALRPDGAVVAMVGGRDYQTSSFNRATAAERQPGSTFKLFVYFAALRAGFEPGDRIVDGPIEIDGWKPENYGGRFSGRVSLAEAFARSLNAATVRLAMDVGIDNVATAARDLGIEADLTETPSLALGASEVTLIDLAGAYASVRAGLAPVEPWGISSFSVEGSDKSFRVGTPGDRRIELSEREHRALIGMLKLVVDRGTGKAASLRGFAAGKTGTSQESRDAWFVGFNEMLTVGVWVGNDDGTPMNRVTGGGLPARIWKDFMVRSAELQGSRGQPETARGESAGTAGGQTPACNVRACSRAYRSFRVSDCTFQPYRGPRKLCTK